MKSILFILHDPHIRSGATASMLSIIEYLSKNGYKIDVLLPFSNEEISSYLSSINVTPYVLYFPNSRFIHGNSLFSNFFERSKCLLKNILCIQSAAKFYFSKNFPKNYDYVYTNTTDTYVGVFISLLINTPHVWHFREFGELDQSRKHLFGDKIFLRLAERFSKYIIVISESLKSHVNNYIISNKIHMIYDDVYKEKIIIRDGSFVEKSHLTFLITGTICKEKGHLEVYEAVRDLNADGIECYLHIAGNDNTRLSKELKARAIHDCCESNLVFLGYRNDLNLLRSKYEFGIVASESEAFGRVTIEGMQDGLIMIASNTGANPELITDGVNGYLYQKGSIESLKNVLNEVMNNRSVHNLISKNAIEYSLHFSENNAAKKIMQILN